MRRFFWLPVIAGIICLFGCSKPDDRSLSAPVPAEADTSVTAQTTTVTDETATETTTTTTTAFDLQYVPDYDSEPYCEINGGMPFFEPAAAEIEPSEFYSPLDDLGRCGVCRACLGPELLPTENRSSIGNVTPSGWQLTRYDGLVDGNYLYNRCHLIGYLLTGQNANPRNLITGTRDLNKRGMLPFEIRVAEYIETTGNHVRYRVTPVFAGENLVASGVLMEACSVEDNGAGVRFCVYCYNVQPGVEIDYATGESHLVGEETTRTETTAETTGTTETTLSESAERTLPAATEAAQVDYVLNTNTRRFHLPDCPSVGDIKTRNREDYSGTRDALIAEGYVPCQRCNP